MMQKAEVRFYLHKADENSFEAWAIPAKTIEAKDILSQYNELIEVAKILEEKNLSAVLGATDHLLFEPFNAAMKKELKENKKLRKDLPCSIIKTMLQGKYYPDIMLTTFANEVTVWIDIHLGR